MGKLAARGFIAAELIMGKLTPCVHPVRGIEPVVPGEAIVRSRDIVSGRKVMGANDVAAHQTACGVAAKAMTGKRMTRITMAGECPATHPMLREPVHATAFGWRPPPPIRKPPPGWKPRRAYMRAATANVEGASAPPMCIPPPP